MSEHVEYLNKVKLQLVSKRRQLAQYAAGELSDHTISNVVECQLEIDALNRAIEDEKKNHNGYALANL
ncbi:hypothetical protein [Rhizobium laguerreae]|uniref:hypothetical protein n=1 Tax=Rhizobium laguerreae TaxID=1076926 RepID=UPI001C9181F8|nr:hypothetical protein [Rhizobium laguerreae]MBY3211777.1 hypothetical protein [Rhizobium laguerreae]